MSKCVLIVDSDHIHNFILRRIVSKVFSCEIDEVYTGEQAMGYITKKCENGEFPDLVFVDTIMPVMDGYEFIEKLKASSLACEKDIFIVVMVLNSSRDVSRFRELGIEAFLEKPVKEEALTSMIKDLYH